jgi:hypothetical protein
MKNCYNSVTIHMYSTITFESISRIIRIFLSRMTDEILNKYFLIRSSHGF